MLDEKLKHLTKKEWEEIKETRDKYYKKIKRMLPQIENKPDTLTELDERYIRDARMIIMRLLENWEKSNKTLDFLNRKLSEQ